MKPQPVRLALLALCGLAAAGLGFHDLTATMQVPTTGMPDNGAHHDHAGARLVAAHRETAPRQPHAPASASAGSAGPGAGKTAMMPREKLVALRAPLSLESVRNPFASSSWLPPPPPPVEVPAAPAARPAPPTAPALPFVYLGGLDANTSKPQVFLSNGDQLLIVSSGQVIDGQYRVDSISDTGVVLTYLPLNQRQVISTQSEGK